MIQSKNWKIPGSSAISLGLSDDREAAGKPEGAGRGWKIFHRLQGEKRISGGGGMIRSDRI